MGAGGTRRKKEIIYVAEGHRHTSPIPQGVRAGGFMQPLGTVRAYEYLAQASLGQERSLS